MIAPAISVLERHAALAMLAEDAEELGLAEVAQTVHELAADLRAPWAESDEAWQLWVETEDAWLAETAVVDELAYPGIDWDAAAAELLGDE